MKRVFGLFIGVVFCITLLSGCTKSNAWNPMNNGGEVKIAVLGASSTFEQRKDFFAGVDLAIEELAKDNKKVSYKFFDDEGNYDNGVSLAKEVAINNDYLMAFTLQDFDTVDTVASLFEENKKPLIIVDGCYDSTMEKGYEYVFSITVKAEDAGNALGQYAVKQGYKWIAVSHSGVYSVDFQEGFVDATSASTSNVIDLMSGPNKESEITTTIERWKALGVDAVVLSFEDMDWAVELVKKIRVAYPQVKILGDQYFNDLKYMKDYGQYLEGLVMPSSFPVDSNDRLKEFYNKYESKITYLDITSVSAQGYDIVNMIMNKLDGAENVGDFISSMKSQEGYEGVAGIKFKLNGFLDKTPKYWEIKNNVVWRQTELHTAS